MSWQIREVVRRGLREPDAVAVEEPLEIRVEGRPLAVAMRTPGADRELAAGFLLAEGVIEGPGDLSALAVVAENVVDCRLAAGVEAHREALARATRELTATSACGVCGKQSLERLDLLAGPVERVELGDAEIAGLAEALRAGQAGFRATGGLHGAALLEAGELDRVWEDVGRHNAVDKALGARLLADRLPASGCALVVSSRAGFEVVQKARMAGVGAVVALGAPTTLAVDLARASGMALLGFAGSGRVNRYT